MRAPKDWADEIWSKGLFMGAAVTQDCVEEIRQVQIDARTDGISMMKQQALQFLQRAHAACPKEAKTAFAQALASWQALP